MSIDSQAVIQALIKMELLQEAAQKPEKAPPCVVAISREAGVCGRAFGEALAERLGVPLYDRELLNAIAEASGVDPIDLESLDEKLSGLRPNWLENLIARKSLLAQSYRKNLINTVLGIGQSGGVIVGRGATFLLEDCPHCLRLRIVGSVDRRATNFAETHKIDVEAAKRQILEIDREREGFVRELTGRDPHDAHGYDLVLNIDGLSEAARLDLILRASRDKPCAASGEG
ncbi:MAG: cytidylate kinase-like family protein [Gammaproteobacteria bacterium]|nr:MAG: cytidylate kinase-like family protein [Gammaproteobacteria bacterium]